MFNSAPGDTSELLWNYFQGHNEAVDSIFIISLIKILTHYEWGAYFFPTCIFVSKTKPQVWSLFTNCWFYTPLSSCRLVWDPSVSSWPLTSPCKPSTRSSTLQQRPTTCQRVCSRCPSSSGGLTERQLELLHSTRSALLHGSFIKHSSFFSANWWDLLIFLSQKTSISCRHDAKKIQCLQYKSFQTNKLLNKQNLNLIKYFMIWSWCNKGLVATLIKPVEYFAQSFFLFL